MRLIRVGGMEAEPPIRAAIKGERHPLLAFPFLWRFLTSNRRVPALRYPGIGRGGFQCSTIHRGYHGFLRH